MIRPSVFQNSDPRRDSICPKQHCAALVAYPTVAPESCAFSRNEPANGHLIIACAEMRIHRKDAVALDQFFKFHQCLG